MMKTIHILFILACLLQVPTYAQKCNTGTTVTADIWQEFVSLYATIPCAAGDGVPSDDCIELMIDLFDHQRHLISFWNKSVNNSWATLGPRKMEPGKKYDGTLIGSTERLFITPHLITKKKVVITIRELDGKGKTGVAVCKVDADNNSVPVATRWFNNTSDRKDDPKEVRRIIIDNARGKLIKLHLDGKSVSNTLKYRIIIEEQDHDRIQKIDATKLKKG